jgi:lysozyme
MKTSPAGIALIEKFEGLRLRAYQDGNGVWSIGYGHTSGVTMGRFETKEQAEADLCADIETAEAAVARLVQAPLTQGQFDALVSFAYNEGQGRLRDSTMLKLLNAGSYALAARAFMSWDVIAGKHSASLAERRRAEVVLFWSAA